MNLSARPMSIVLRITCAKWSDTKAKRVIVLNDVDPSQIGDDFGTIYIVMREGPGSLFNSFAQLVQNATETFKTFFVSDT